MRCLHPSVFRTPDGGTLVVPCNRCMACRVNKTEEWSNRLLFENEQYEKSCFVTLTYAPEYEPINRSLVKEDMQKFIKRVRKHYAGNKASTIKYYLCGEYGPTTFRPHYHAIIFGADFEPETWQEYKPKHFSSPTLLDLWPFGFNEVSHVNKTTMNYVTGYIQKKQFGYGSKVYDELGVIPPFQLFSKGLGLKFAEDHKSQLVHNMFISVKGKKAPLPKYYSRKLGLCDEKTPEGYSLLQEKAYLEEQRRRDEHPELDAFEFAQFEHGVRVQREIDMKGRERLYPSRDKI